MRGSFGAFTDEEYLPERSGRRWIKRTLLVVLALGVLGGGAYAGYHWTQQQYFVGVNGDHVALYQGVSQDLGPVSLSEVHEDHPEIRLEDLPDFQRSEVERSISTGDLPEARAKVAELGEQAEACRVLAEIRAADGDEEAADLPELSEEQQSLARHCTG